MKVIYIRIFTMILLVFLCGFLLSIKFSYRLPLWNTQIVYPSIPWVRSPKKTDTAIKQDHQKYPSIKPTEIRTLTSTADTSSVLKSPNNNTAASTQTNTIPHKGPVYVQVGGQRVNYNNPKTPDSTKTTDSSKSPTDTTQGYGEPCTGKYVFKGPCTCVRFPDHDLPGSVLYSLPGSGNTWTRFLLEQASGYFTGSFYNDEELKNGGFLGESMANNRVFAIKSHRLLARSLKLRKAASDRPIEKVVVLLRDMYQAAVSEINRRLTRGSHTATAEFNTKAVQSYVHNLHSWANKRTLEWISQRKMPIFILRYEALKRNLTEALGTTMGFLQLPVSKNRLECIRKYSEGKFHRKTSYQPPLRFSKLIRDAVDTEENLLEATLQARYKAVPHLTFGYINSSANPITSHGDASNMRFRSSD